LYREQIHQRYLEIDQGRGDSTKLIIELAYKIKELASLKEIDVYYASQSNLMSFIDLYQRCLELAKDEHQAERGELSSFNKYLTFYNSLEDQKKIYSHNVAVRNPEEGAAVQTVEINFDGEDPENKQLVEKVFTRLDEES